METKSQREKEFLAMLEQHKRVIYKVCYLYAGDTAQLDDLYQETVLNLWRAFPRISGREFSCYMGVSDQSEYLYFVSPEVCQTVAGCYIAGQSGSF